MLIDLRFKCVVLLQLRGSQLETVENVVCLISLVKDVYLI